MWKSFGLVALGAVSAIATLWAIAKMTPPPAVASPNGKAVCAVIDDKLAFCEVGSVLGSVACQARIAPGDFHVCKAFVAGQHGKPTKIEFWCKPQIGGRFTCS